MQITETYLKDCYIIQPKVFADKRGYFFESFNKQKFQETTNLSVDFVQDNQSKSGYGVLRGLHYQLAPYAQAKLVRVLQGKVLDVCVDIREGSPTLGQAFSIELSDENQTQLFIPRGFAHGFIVLSETAVFNYKCDNYYHPESESGIIFNDPELAIDWKLPENELIISEKDQILKPFAQAEKNFAYKS